MRGCTARSRRITSSPAQPRNALSLVSRSSRSKASAGAAGPSSATWIAKIAAARLSARNSTSSGPKVIGTRRGDLRRPDRHPVVTRRLITHDEPPGRSEGYWDRPDGARRQPVEQVGVGAAQALEVGRPHLGQEVLAVHGLAADDLGFEDLGAADGLALEVVARRLLEGHRLDRRVLERVAGDDRAVVLHEHDALVAERVDHRQVRLHAVVEVRRLVVVEEHRHRRCTSRRSALRPTTAPTRSASGDGRCRSRRGVRGRCGRGS